MSETGLKFGPEWLRALSHGNTAASPPDSPGPIPFKCKLADYRYGREEMLGLFTNEKAPPDVMENLGLLYIEQIQPPLAFAQSPIDEQRMHRSVNSEAVLRSSGRITSSSVGRGRGGVSDRGRGRGRSIGAPYYSRGAYEEDGVKEVGPPGMPLRQKSYERSHSMTDARGRGTYRTGDRSIDDRMGTSPQRGRSTFGNWRSREPIEEADRWKGLVGSRNEKWGSRGGWREEFEETRPIRIPGRQPRRWSNERDNEENLPEWAKDIPEDKRGGFDELGKFYDSRSSDEENFANSYDEPKEIGAKKLSRLGAKNVDGFDAKNPDEFGAQSFEENGKFLEGDGGKFSESDVGGEKFLHSEGSQGKSFDESGGKINIGRGKSSNESTRPGSVQNGSREEERKSEESGWQTDSSSDNNLKFEGLDSGNSRLPPHLNLVNGDLRREETCHSSTRYNSNENENENNDDGRPQLKPQFVSKRRDDDHIMSQVMLGSAADDLVARLVDDVVDDELHNLPPLLRPPPGGFIPTSSNPPIPISSPDEQWFYMDPQGEVQGPFSASDMGGWYKAGYFKATLLLKRQCDDKFAQLGDLIRLFGRIPFLPGPVVPPLKVSEAELVNTAQRERDRFDMLQAQNRQVLHKQQIYQQQSSAAALRQQQVLQSLQSLDEWNSLNSAQQQQLFMQHLMAQPPAPIPAPVGLDMPPVNQSLPPNLNSNLQPGMGSNLQTSIGSNLQPGMISNSQTGMGSNLQPGMGSNLQPGMGSNLQPGMGSNLQPGMRSNLQPGMSSNSQPIMGSNLQPGSGSNLQPSLNSNLQSVNRNITSVAPIHPNSQSMPPNLQSIAPNVQSMASNLQSMAPNLQVLAPNLQSVSPNLQQMDLQANPYINVNNSISTNSDLRLSSMSLPPPPSLGFPPSHLDNGATMHQKPDPIQDFIAQMTSTSTVQLPSPDPPIDALAPNSIQPPSASPGTEGPLQKLLIQLQKGPQGPPLGHNVPFNQGIHQGASQATTLSIQGEKTDRGYDAIQSIMSQLKRHGNSQNCTQDNNAQEKDNLDIQEQIKQQQLLEEAKQKQLLEEAKQQQQQFEEEKRKNNIRMKEEQKRRELETKNRKLEEELKKMQVQKSKEDNKKKNQKANEASLKEDKKKAEVESKKKEELKKKDENKKIKEEEKKRKELEKDKQRQLQIQEQIKKTNLKEEKKRMLQLEEEKKRLQKEDKKQKQKEEKQKNDKEKPKTESNNNIKNNENNNKVAWFTNEPCMSKSGAAPSLAEIQKAQEIRDKKEKDLELKRENKRAKEAAKIAAEEQKKQDANLKWASKMAQPQAMQKTKKSAASSELAPVKSLIEIQREEERALKERQAFEQAERSVAVKEMPLNVAGVWGASAQSLSWANRASSGSLPPPPNMAPMAASPQSSGGLWSSESQSFSGGFWDNPEPVKVVKGNSGGAKVPNTTASSSANTNPSQASKKGHEGPQAVTSNKANKKMKGAKDDTEAPKKFGAGSALSTSKGASSSKGAAGRSSANEVFMNWCKVSLNSMKNRNSIDVPTFVGFLCDVDSPYEVHDYIRSYLGDSKEVKEFAKQFLERRSRVRNASKEGAAGHDNILAPAPAVNPTSCLEFQEVKQARLKKGRKKLQKSESGTTGFSLNSLDGIELED